MMWKQISRSIDCETPDKIMQFCSVVLRLQLGYSLLFCALCFEKDVDYGRNSLLEDKKKHDL